MLIALLSDVHANLVALQAVKKDFLGRADAVWCLGDVFGYGPWPAETWDALHSLGLPLTLIAGNHDWGLIGHPLVSIQYIQGSAGSSINVGLYNDCAAGILGQQRSALTAMRAERLEHGQDDPLAALQTLPLVCSPASGIYLAHGRLDLGNDLFTLTRNSDEFSSAERSLQSAWELTRAASPVAGPAWVEPAGGWQAPTVICVGHNHVRALWRRSSADPLAPCEWETVSLGSEPIPLDGDGGRTAYLNPGSVGFPRDGIGPASYALLDLEKRTVNFRVIGYDVEAVRVRAAELGYPDCVNGFLANW